MYIRAVSSYGDVARLLQEQGFDHLNWDTPNLSYTNPYWISFLSALVTLSSSKWSGSGFWINWVTGLDSQQPTGFEWARRCKWNWKMQNRGWGRMQNRQRSGNLILFFRADSTFWGPWTRSWVGECFSKAIEFMVATFTMDLCFLFFVMNVVFQR